MTGTLIVDHGVKQVIRTDRPGWVPVFRGLSVRRFQKLVRIVADRGGDQTGAGRRRGLVGFKTLVTAGDQLADCAALWTVVAKRSFGDSVW